MKKIILALYTLYLPFQLKIEQLPIGNFNYINAFLILLALIYLITSNRNKPQTSFEKILFLFLAVWFFSYIHAFFMPNRLWAVDLTREFKRLFTLILGYFVFSRCLKTKKDIYFLYYVFIMTIVLIGVHTMRNGTLSGIHYSDFKRSSGPFGADWTGADIAGGFLATFTPFVFGFFLFTRKLLHKIIISCLLIICILGLLTTYSRGSMMALAISLIITILLSLRGVFKHSKIFTGVLILSLLFLIIGWKKWVPESITARASSTVEDSSSFYDDTIKFDESSTLRMDRWKIGLEVFKQNPIFGVGFKGSEFDIGTTRIDTHNTFILVAAEMGVIGVIVFFWLLLMILRDSLPLLKTEFNFLGIGFVGCIISFVFVNMFYANFFRDTVVGSFWIILGILTACKSYVIQYESK